MVPGSCAYIPVLACKKQVTSVGFTPSRLDLVYSLFTARRLFFFLQLLAGSTGFKLHEHGWGHAVAVGIMIHIMIPLKSCPDHSGVRPLPQNHSLKPGAAFLFPGPKAGSMFSIRCDDQRVLLRNTGAMYLF